MELVTLIGASTWRITHILLRENGPFKMFRRLREALGVRYDDELNEDRVTEFKYEITVCIWCLSVWVATLIAAAYVVAPTPTAWVCRAFAASALAVVIDHYEGVNK